MSSQQMVSGPASELVYTMGKARIPTYEEVSMYYVYLCKICGVLPLEVRCTYVKFLPAVYFHFVNSVYYSMHTTAGIRMIIEHDFDISFVFESILIHGLCSRFLVLYLQRSRVNHLMIICQHLWQLLNDDEGKNVKRFEKKVRYLMYYFLWTTLAATMLYNVAAYFTRLPPATVNGTERRVLPSRFYVEVQEEPWYQIASVFENIILLSYTIIIMTIETIGPFFIMMACGFLRTIRYRLISMTSELNNSNTNNVETVQMRNLTQLNLKEVMNCVTFHQKVIVYCEKIEEVTGKLFIIQILCTAYNISLIGIKLLEHDQRAMQYVPILILNLLQLFTCQWIPEHLLNESKNIANAAYSAMLAHPVYDHKANQMLLFMMIRAQKPITMKAGYIKLSLESFGRMCTSAISFFAVLRSVNEEENV